MEGGRGNSELHVSSLFFFFFVQLQIPRENKGEFYFIPPDCQRAVLQHWISLSSICAGRDIILTKSPVKMR